MISNDNLKSIEYQDNSFFIKWYITDLCNYHCPYCLHVANMELDRSYYSKEYQNEIEHKATLINNILVDNKIDRPIWLRIMGGEATIFNLIPIIDNIKLKICNIGIVTNFYRPIEYFIDLYNYCKNRKISLHLTLSYHEENKNFFEKALKLTEWCRKNNIKDPEINVVVTADFDTDFVDKYIKKGLNRIRALRVRGEYGILDPNLPKKCIDWVNKVNEINRNNSKSKGKYLVTYYDGTQEYRSTMSDFTGEFDQGGLIPDGRSCSMGKDAIFIRSDDNIYRTCCGYLSDDVIGNLYAEKVILPKESIICHLNKNNPNKDYRCIPCYHLRIGERR